MEGHGELWDQSCTVLKYIHAPVSADSVSAVYRGPKKMEN
jgi:hypothetical protein